MLPNCYTVTHLKCVRLFNKLNKELFGGVLFQFRNIYIRHMCDDDMFALTEESTKLQCNLHIEEEFPTYEVFKMIFAHEMLHNYQWVEYGLMDHSRKQFLSWKNRFAKFGIELKINYY